MAVPSLVPVGLVPSGITAHACKQCAAEQAAISCPTTSSACYRGPTEYTPGSVIHQPDLELRQLRTFVAVARRRSFTRAAEDLAMAQQAVSQQIKALERSLGVMLLRRTPRSVELTPEGNLFLTDCRRVLAAADRAARRVKAAAHNADHRCRALNSGPKTVTMTRATCSQSD